jgi:hypothetical protein
LKISLINLSNQLFKWFLEGSSESSDYLIERSEKSKQCSLEFTTCDQLKRISAPGDLIEFNRCHGLYSHWGVLVTEKEVIHLSICKTTGLEIRTDKLETVANNGFCRVNNFESASIRNRPNIRINNKYQVISKAFQWISSRKIKVFLTIV